MLSQNHARLDKIEVELTPKEWAIKLADQMRPYPDQMQFLRAVVQRPYHESPYAKPLAALEAQAKSRYPGKKPNDLFQARALSDKLREEYWALETLISNVNRNTEIEMDRSPQKVCALAERLRHLILEDASARRNQTAVAWIEQHSSTDEEGRKAILEALAEDRRVRGSRALLFSRARDWADDAAALLGSICIAQAVVVEIQNKFFDGHAILYRSIERTVEVTLKQLLETIALYNEYVKTTEGESAHSSESMPRPLPGDGQPAATGEQEAPPLGSLFLDVEAIRGRACDFVPRARAVAWQAQAVERGITEILRANKQHRNLLWERFCEKVARRTEGGNR